MARLLVLWLLAALAGFAQCTITFNPLTGLPDCATGTGGGGGGGIGSLGGQTGSTQVFATGTAGTSPAISSAGNIHTLNVPYAGTGGVSLGALSNTDWINFNAKAAGVHTHSAADIVSGALATVRGGLGVDASGFSGVLRFVSGAASMVPGSAGDCVKVDGSSGSCGAGSSASGTFPAGSSQGFLAHNFATVTHQVPACLEVSSGTPVIPSSYVIGLNQDTVNFAGNLAADTICYTTTGGAGGGGAGIEVQDNGGTVIGTGFTKLRFANGNVSWTLADLGSGLARATPNLVGYGGQAFMVNPGAATLAAAQTLYGSPSAGSLNSNRDVRDVASPFACTLRDLYVRTASTQSGTGSLVVTLQVNGVDTAITATIAAGAAAFATATDTTNTASVNQFDRVVAKYVNNASATSAQLIQTSWRCN